MNIASALCDSGKQGPKSRLAVQVDYADFDAQHIIQLSVTAKSQFNVGTAVTYHILFSFAALAVLLTSVCGKAQRMSQDEEYHPLGGQVANLN